MNDKELIKLLNEIIDAQEEALKAADEVIKNCFKQIDLLKEKIAVLEKDK